MNIDITDQRNEHDDAVVASVLRAYNSAFIPRDFRPLRVYTRDSSGAIIGGLLADTYWEYLDIHVLWVDEAYRHQGHAARMLIAAEREAQQRACKHAFLDTFAFQARGFYEKCGYAEFGRLEGFGGKYARHYLHKALENGPR